MNTTFSDGLPEIMTKRMHMEHKQANAIAQAFLNKTKYGITERAKLSPNQEKNDSPDNEEKVSASKYHDALMKSNQ